MLNDKMKTIDVPDRIFRHHKIVNDNRDKEYPAARHHFGDAIGQRPKSYNEAAWQEDDSATKRK